MKITFVLYATILCWSISFSQVIFPEIPKKKKTGIKLRGMYNPGTFFLNANPDFLTTGDYNFSIDYYLPDLQSIDRGIFSGYNRFNSREYPVVKQTPQRDFSKYKTHFIIQFTTQLESYSWFYMDKGKGTVRFRSKTQGFDLLESSKDKDSYTNVNLKYKETVSNILLSKNCQSFKIVDLGSLEIADDSLSISDIVLQFVFIQNNTWVKEATLERFPSHSLYKLIVKDIYGDTLKTFGQGIFYDGDKMKSDFSNPGFMQYFESFINDAIYPIAFDNLLNRLLNDDEMYSLLYEMEKEKSTNHLELSQIQLDTGKQYLYSLVKLKSKKEQLRFDLNLISSNLRSVGVSIDDLNKNVSPEWQYATNKSILISLFDFFNTKRNINDVRSVMNENKQLFNLIKFKYESLKEKKIQLPDKNYIPLELRLMNDKILSLDDNIDLSFGFIDKVLNTLNSNFSSVSNTLTTRSVNNLQNSFNNEFNSNQTGVIKNSPTVETLAESNENGNNSMPGNIDPCFNRAKSELYRSTEYYTWTNKKTSASMYDYQAKLAELTLKYCMDKLPANEIRQIDKTAKNARKLADDLRRQNNNGKFDF